MSDDEPVRILIAVTESSPITELWQAVLSRRSFASEVVALYIADDRWLRAASLPFTREISRLGSVANFTRQRADQLNREAVSGIERRIRALATESDLGFAFEELSASNAERLEELVLGERSIVIAPAVITRQPIYTRMVSLGCRIELIGTVEGSTQAQRVS